MNGWAEVRPEDGGKRLLAGEVPEGTSGAVPSRFEVDMLGRRVPVAWTFPAAGARDHWDARRAGPNLLERTFE